MFKTSCGKYQATLLATAKEGHIIDGIGHKVWVLTNIRMPCHHELMVTGDRDENRFRQIVPVDTAACAALYTDEITPLWKETPLSQLRLAQIVCDGTEVDPVDMLIWLRSVLE